MLIFLFTQHQCQPFLIHAANTMESILLSCLILVISGQTSPFMNDTFREILISFLIIFPLILLIYFIVRYNFRNHDQKEVLDTKRDKNWNETEMAEVTADYQLLIDEE